MKTHPYVRAYVAGIAVPTLLLLVTLAGLIFLRLVLQAPAPIERLIVFPMAVVPNLFGLWNMLYFRLSESRSISIGVHGALLPFILAPLGGTLAWSLGYLRITQSGLVYFDAVHVSYGLLAGVFCLTVGIYYLGWKYFVNFFNGVVGIA